MVLIRYCLQATTYVLLGGINGALVTIMAIIRNLFMYHKRFTNTVMYTWISVSLVINVLFMNKISDLFPFAATMQFTLMAKKQNVLWLKYAQIINTIIWGFYHIAIQSYVYLIFDVFLLIVGFIRIKVGVIDD